MLCCFHAYSATDGDILVNGISDNAEHIVPGDIYCCINKISAMDVVDAHDAYHLQQALLHGAVAVIAEADMEMPELPDEVPVIYAEDVEELASRLAAVFYGEITYAMGGAMGGTVCKLQQLCVQYSACSNVCCVNMQGAGGAKEILGTQPFAAIRSLYNIMRSAC